MKEKYTKLEITIEELSCNDVITTSGVDDEEVENAFIDFFKDLF